MSKKWLFFRSIENKHDLYRGKNCKKKFCEFLREDAMEITNFKKKKWSCNKSINKRLLTKEQQESHENSKTCYIYKEKFKDKYLKDKIFCKGRDHCHDSGEYRGAGNITCNSKVSVPK